MTRVTSTPATRRRRKKIIKKAEGYFGSKHKLFKTAREQLIKSWTYAYRDRKQKKRNFRRWWIILINNACRKLGINYSRFIYSLRHLEGSGPIKLNRKILAQMIRENPEQFEALREKIADKN